MPQLPTSKPATMQVDVDVDAPLVSKRDAAHAAMLAACDDAELSALATQYDAADALRCARHQFDLPSGVYLCGHSLGPMPRGTRARLMQHCDKWAALAVDGHFTEPEPWADIEKKAARLVKPVVGAKHDHEVAVMNSLTVNLHLMLTAFYRPVGRRTKIVIEDHAFSSDEYAVQTHIRARHVHATAAAATADGIDSSSGASSENGRRSDSNDNGSSGSSGSSEDDDDEDSFNVDDHIVRIAPRPGEGTLRDEDILSTIRWLDTRGELALVLLPGVQYYTGQVFPMKAVAAECNARNIPVGFDLAHAVGNVPLHLHDWGVDFGVWCHYKYLNSGPGAVAGLFLHDRHADADVSTLPRYAGWWGHDRATRFAMPRAFKPQRGAPGFQVSNPPVLAVVPVAEALATLEKAGGVAATRRKSVALVRFLRRCLDKRLKGSIDVVTPEQEERHGSQVSMRIRRLGDSSGDGRCEGSVSVDDVNDALGRCGMTCDVRRPDVIRVAAAPLFNSFGDVWALVRALEHVLESTDLLVARGAAGDTGQ